MLTKGLSSSRLQRGVNSVKMGQDGFFPPLRREMIRLPARLPPVWPSSKLSQLRTARTARLIPVTAVMQK
jgi:hypothetical protein